MNYAMFKFVTTYILLCHMYRKINVHICLLCWCYFSTNQTFIQRMGKIVSIIEPTHLKSFFCKASKAWAILRSMHLWIYLSKLESKFPSQSDTFLEKVFTLCNNFLKCRLHWLITLLFQSFPSLCCVCCIYIESKIFFLWLIVIKKSLQCLCRSSRCMKTFWLDLAQNQNHCWTSFLFTRHYTEKKFASPET